MRNSRRRRRRRRRLTCEPGVGKHADLVDDVVPVPGGLALNKGITQGLSHVFDAIRHDLDVLVPCERNEREVFRTTTEKKKKKTD